MDVRSILYNPSRWPTQRLLLCLGFLALVALIRPAGGQESSPQWWNPMSWGSADGTVRKSSYFSDSGKKTNESKSWLSLPQAPWSASDQPATEKPASATSSSPSVFSKVGKSTKRAWNNTVDFLNPFDQQPAQPQQQGYRPQNTTTKKGSGMFGWMWREETTETPTSVNEFLRQERPRF